MKTFERLQLVNDYTTGCLLVYNCFKNFYRMTAIDFSKQQALDTDPKAVQKFHFTSNLDRARNTKFFITEETKERFFTRNCV